MKNRGRRGEELAAKMTKAAGTRRRRGADGSVRVPGNNGQALASRIQNSYSAQVPGNAARAFLSGSTPRASLDRFCVRFGLFWGFLSLTSWVFHKDAYLGVDEKEKEVPRV